jgi:hypothetical protein
VNLPDTLHCANISIISDASCDKDYPGRIGNTMVCAGVQGGGTDSCEVRAERGHSSGGGEGTRTVLGVGVDLDFVCLGPGREDIWVQCGDKRARAVRMVVRLELGSGVGAVAVGLGQHGLG